MKAEYLSYLVVSSILLSIKTMEIYAVKRMQIISYYPLFLNVDNSINIVSDDTTLIVFFEARS